MWSSTSRRRLGLQHHPLAPGVHRLAFPCNGGHRFETHGGKGRLRTDMALDGMFSTLEGSAASSVADPTSILGVSSGGHGIMMKYDVSPRYSSIPAFQQGPSMRVPFKKRLVSCYHPYAGCSLHLIRSLRLTYCQIRLRNARRHLVISATNSHGSGSTDTELMLSH